MKVWCRRAMYRSGRREAEGQSVVELALVLPILVLLTLGFIQVMHAYRTEAAMNTSLFVGLRAASTHADRVPHSRFDAFANLALAGLLHPALGANPYRHVVSPDELRREGQTLMAEMNCLLPLGWPQWGQASLFFPRIQSRYRMFKEDAGIYP